MFKYCPVDVATYLAALLVYSDGTRVVHLATICFHVLPNSTSLQQYVFYVLLPYIISCIYYQLGASWCPSYDNTFSVLALGLLLLNSPFRPWLHNDTRNFSLSTDGLSTWQNCPCIGFVEFFFFLVFSATLKQILVILGSSFSFHTFLFY
jgi:hypothetical protein